MNSHFLVGNDTACLTIFFEFASALDRMANKKKEKIDFGLDTCCSSWDGCKGFKYSYAQLLIMEFLLMNRLIS